MTNTETDTTPALLQRPMRADARRNYDKLLTAAHDAFAEHGTSTSLEEIARRAGVGIGTLYRHFPTRQALLEAVYVDEVEAMARTATDLADLPPWDALSGWLHRFVGYVATKQALADELLSYLDKDSEVFRSCRVAVLGAGDSLLRRAQDAGAVRPDATIDEVTRLVVGIAKIPAVEPEQIDRILELALDGLRYTPSGA